MIRLDDNESGQLTTPLTTQNLLFQGGSGITEATSFPTYSGYLPGGKNTLPKADGDVVGTAVSLANTDNLASAIAKMGYLFPNRFGDTFKGAMVFGAATTGFSAASLTFQTGSTCAFDSGSTCTFANNTLKLAGAGAGIATLTNANNAANCTFRVPVKAAGTYTLATTAEIPDLSHVTYDNVAETVASEWVFTSGANFGVTTGLIHIGNTIYLSGTDVDNQMLWINYYGFEGTNTRYRDLGLGDGRCNQIFLIDGATKSVYVAQSSAYFYTRAIDPPVSGTDIAGNAIPRNSLVTAQALAKAWVIFTTDDTPTATIQNSYNIDTVAWNAGDDDFTVTFDANFANANYVIVGSTGKVSGAPPDYDAGIFTIGDRAVGSCRISARNTDNSGNTCDEREFHIVFYGDLAT